MLAGIRSRLLSLLALAVLITAGAIMAATGLAARGGFVRFVKSDERQRAAGLAELIREAYETNGRMPDLERFIQPRRGMMFAHPPMAGPMMGPERVVVTDEAGVVMADSYPPGGLAPPRLPHPGEEGVPVQSRGRIIARVFLGSMVTRDLSPLQADFLRSLGRGVAVGALLAGGVAIGLGWLLLRTIVRPLEQLSTAAARIAAGDFNARLEPSGAREFRAVTASFNAMNESLRKSDEWRRRVIGDIAHELRTPLTILRGTLEAMTDGVYPMNLENLKSAYDETRSLERLVDELRELSLLESPGLRLSLQKIDAGVLAAQAAQAFAGVFAERGLRLENNIPTGLPPVSADPGRFLQVVRNLLDNAAKYCPAGSKLSMSAEAEADKRPARLALAIADDGPGVPRAELELIFDRFHRVEKSRSRATGGSGLGLAIVKSIIEAHGGEVRAEQVEPHGLRVKFSLPLA